jgi:hypothetical protein
MDWDLKTVIQNKPVFRSMAEAVEHLPSKFEVLSSSPHTFKNLKKGRKNKKQAFSLDKLLTSDFLYSNGKVTNTTL